MYIHIHIHIYTYTHIYICTYMCIYTYIYTHVYIYMYILVNPLPGVETNVYLICRFTGWLVGWFDDLPVCPLAKLEACMDMNIMFQNIVFKSVLFTHWCLRVCVSTTSECACGIFEGFPDLNIFNSSRYYTKGPKPFSGARKGPDGSYIFAVILRACARGWPKCEH